MFTSSGTYPNVEELPSFIAQHRRSTPQRSFTTSADPNQLQGRQLHAYNIILHHYQSNCTEPLHMIVSGTAGTGKSYLINCIRLFLQENVVVAAPTGVAAFNIDGCTLHSLLGLPVRGEYKDLQGDHLNRMQQSLIHMKYLLIDEMSMVGRKLFGQIDKRLRQVFPHNAHQPLGGCSCVLFGDFGQLPPVMDLPLYTIVPRSALSDLGSSVYQLFDHVVVLEQVRRQHGDSPAQVMFRNILLDIRDGQATEEDWKNLMTRTPMHARNLPSFSCALCLFPTLEAVVDYNVSKLHSCGYPVATIKAVHSGPNASKASPDDAGGLEPIINLCVSARVMLSANLWVEMGLVNGAMGIVKAICYQNDELPPHLPVVVTVKFDGYTGPTLPDGTVPIPPVRRTWSSSGMQCSRLQLPLRLAWAVTIHKAQGLTLDKVVIDIGKKEFSSGLTFVACSRVRRLDDILFNQTFTYERLTSLSKSRRLQERLVEDTRLRHSTIATLHSHGIIIDEPEVNIPSSSPNVCSPTSPNHHELYTPSISPPTFTMLWTHHLF